MKLEEKNTGILKDSDYIIKRFYHYYTQNSINRYKHLDKLLLSDGKIINATPSRADMVAFAILEPDTVYTVTSAEEHRIDILATKFYGRASLYWILCYANPIKLKDPLNIPAGTDLVVPKLVNMYQHPNPLA